MVNFTSVNSKQTSNLCSSCVKPQVLEYVTESHMHSRKEVSMTRNQIEYFGQLENQRSNLVREKETNRSNREQEAIAQEKNRIQERYNRSYLSELTRNNYAVLSENRRHNIATEGTQLLSTQVAAQNARNQRYATDVNAATSKYNTMATLQQGLNIASQQVSENRRANMAREDIQRQQTRNDYNIRKESNVINMLNAQTAKDKLAHQMKVDISMLPYQQEQLSSQAKQNYANTNYTVERTSVLPVEVGNSFLSSISGFARAIK